MRYATLTPLTAAGTPPAQPWVIADDTIRGPGSRFLEEGGPSLQQHLGSTAYLGGTFELNEQLGNRQVRFSMTVNYEFADESELFLFWTRLPLTMPGEGTLEFGTYGTGGAKTLYTNCVLESVRPVDVTVVSIKLLFVFRAGRPQGVT